jgi:excisionase family DNA binding protein
MNVHKRGGGKLMTLLDERKDQQAFSPKEAALILGRPVSTIRKWLREKKIRGNQVGTSWLVPRSELERLVKTQENNQGGDTEER